MRRALRRMLLRRYREELAMGGDRLSQWAARYERILHALDGDASSAHLRHLDFWSKQEPFLSTRRVFGRVDSLMCRPHAPSIIRGWMFDVIRPIDSLSLWMENRCVASGPVWEVRDDVSAVFPGEPHSRACGFEFFIEEPLPPTVTFRFTARTVAHERLHGVFGPTSSSVAPAIASKREEPETPHADMPLLILVQPRSDQDPKLLQARIAAEVAIAQGFSCRLVLINRSPSESVHLLADFPRLSVVRSVDEFVELLLTLPSPTLLLALHPDALWYCERLMRIDATLLSRVAIVDDSRSFFDESVADTRPHRVRSRFAPVVIEPSTEPSSGRSVEHRLWIEAPHELDKTAWSQVYQGALAYLRDIA